ncbi:MAG: chemotaxis protein [Leptothrix sp. (in: Bacteria)]|nr:chemotaxis protein [Leptothrix sp. (in: b-proteobacteria)]
MRQDTPRSIWKIQAQDFVVLSAMAATLLGALIYGGVYNGIGLALAAGVPIMIAALLVSTSSRGGPLSQWLLPALGMAMVGLMIHVARGHNEAHFAVFAFMACLVTYRKAVPILVGATTIAVHHVLFNQLQTWAWGPLCFTEPGFGKVVEHALYVVAETAVLLFLAAQARKDFATAQELMAIVDRLQADDGSVDLSVADTRSDDQRTMRLLDALRHIAQSINQVRQAAESVRVASDEISAGNQSLSQRTEQAAANIEETAASVEMIVSTIRSTSTNAQQANQLAGTASQFALAGGESVSRVVTTMSDIQQSSRKITDIIGVIDGIAFQTNILALNAAVEAARAGEQGRGFAVVASEVRMLAQRSAEAAKEIKQLIGSSVDQVEAGSTQVDSAGQTMSELVGQVRRVTELVGLIAVSSSEQNDGIGQINQAIGRMDQATQHNAALVEQTAAAAESLSRQADELSHAMGVFRVPASLQR